MKKNNKRKCLMIISVSAIIVAALNRGAKNVAQMGGIQMGGTPPSLKDLACIAIGLLIGIILGFVLRKICQRRYLLISTILIALGFIVIMLMDSSDLDNMFFVLALPLFYNNLKVKEQTDGE